jgi:hypothetical protein
MKKHTFLTQVAFRVMRFIDRQTPKKRKRLLKRLKKPTGHFRNLIAMAIFCTPKPDKAKFTLDHLPEDADVVIKELRKLLKRRKKESSERED